jgi:hypothetical protein
MARPSMKLSSNTYGYVKPHHRVRDLPVLIRRYPAEIRQLSSPLSTVRCHDSRLRLRILTSVSARKLAAYHRRRDRPRCRDGCGTPLCASLRRTTLMICVQWQVDPVTFKITPMWTNADLSQPDGMGFGIGGGWLYMVGLGNPSFQGASNGMMGSSNNFLVVRPRSFLLAWGFHVLFPHQDLVFIPSPSA